VAFTQRLAEAGVAPSVGSVGDALDNALTKTEIGLFKTELIHHRGPWKGLTTSNSLPWNGSTGTTSDGYKAPATT
jgi:transposase InsO family protein